MTITITQTCDGCGATRSLNAVANADHGGWRKATELKHLCVDCIKKALDAQAS